MILRSRHPAYRLLVLAASVFIAWTQSASAQTKELPRQGEVFLVDGRTAFIIEPPEAARRDGPLPWVWYAPTLDGLPSRAETWMFDRFLAAGIAVAGIDVGESYGSPDGTRRYQALYEHLTTKRGYASRPVLLARSRGGLMLYNWAVEHPRCVAAIAGIYPVCNLASYPGLARAAPAFGMNANELAAQLTAHNPVDRLAPLAQARVPILHVHGDSDATVPLEANSELLGSRYAALGGPAEISVVEGRGHDMWSGWFQSEELTDFAIRHALAAAGPVQVYILSGQSNMVGIGQISGGSTRWGKEIIDPVVSVYSGAYSAEADYDSLTPIATKSLPVYGGTEPTPFPGGGTQIVRGFIEIDSGGVYELSPGYAGSTYNVMEVAGVEVYRREVDEEAARTPLRFTRGERRPFKITFFTEAANGLGWLWRTDVPGTLTTVVKTQGKFPHLLKGEGRWAVRDDVWYMGLVTATANKWLAPGCGANANSIGPELQFGHVVGDYHDAPVLLIKTSQGNRSLGWDFLPPDSPRFTWEGRTYAGSGDKVPSWTSDEPGKEVDWYAGLQYDQCFEAVHEVLDHFADHFPQYADRGYEVAGFVWWQGHKDGNAAHASRYELNLVNLIRSLRSEFDAAAAPFVIGTIGFGGWEMSGPHLTVANAQLAVSGEKGKYPEFAGNVLTVETRDFWKVAADSPRNQGFHYNGNAETYLMVGDALGRGMVELLGGR
ncbi:MAG: hypothetical protein GY711_12130 [bacterium]|nr:hypothetical protein [bacterium]